MIKCNLAEILARKGLKIKDLAKNTGVSRTTLTALYYNQGKGVQFDTMDQICFALDITPGELFSQYTAGLMVHQRSETAFPGCFVLELDCIVNDEPHNGIIFCGIPPDENRFLVALTVKFLNKLEAIPNNHFVDLVFMLYSSISGRSDLDSIANRDLAILESADEEAFKRLITS